MNNEQQNWCEHPEWQRDINFCSGCEDNHYEKHCIKYSCMKCGYVIDYYKRE